MHSCVTVLHFAKVFIMTECGSVKRYLGVDNDLLNGVYLSKYLDHIQMT